MDTLQVLTNRIQFLEHRIDSIQHSESLKELSMRVNEQANIISNVGSFYESAWLKLIIVISLLGIIIPILIQYFQKNTLKEVTNFLSTEIKNTFDLRIKSIEESNKQQIDLLSDRINSEIFRINKSYDLICFDIEASLFYLQGKQSFSSKNYGNSLKDFLKSVEFWMKSSKPERTSVPFTNAILCINEMKTKAVFEKVNSELGIDWEHFWDLFKEEPLKTLYKDNISKMRKSISSLT